MRKKIKIIKYNYGLRSRQKKYDDNETQEFILKYATLFKDWKGDNRDYNRSEFIKQLEDERYPSEDIKKIRDSEIIRRKNKMKNQLVDKSN